MSAAMDRPKLATYMTHESKELATEDNEDHTFCGMMFNVEAKVADGQMPIPVDYLEITGVAVRGQLGVLEVFSTPDSYAGKHEDPTAWTKCYEGRHEPSPREYALLPFPEPIRLHPGESCGLYVHSSLPGDQAIVYDEDRLGSREDWFVRVHRGMAHLSNKAFGRRGPWGTAWRNNREFVGRVSYGIKYVLWNPEVHDKFPKDFQHIAHLLLWAPSQEGSTIAALPEEVVFYVLNMCRWDWLPLKDKLEDPEPPLPRRLADPIGHHWLYRQLIAGWPTAGVDDDDDDDADEEGSEYEEIDGEDDEEEEEERPEQNAHLTSSAASAPSAAPAPPVRASGDAIGCSPEPDGKRHRHG